MEPSVDIAAAAEEVKRFLDSKKMDLVDYSFNQIEAYPPSDSAEYPVLGAFSRQWKEFFDDAEKTLADAPDEMDGKNFAEILGMFDPAIAKRLGAYDDLTAKIAAAVNSDSAFWQRLRDEIIPLYDKSPYFEQWKQRWKSVTLHYDPVGLDVTTTQIWRDAEGKKKVTGNVIRSTSYPAGFIVRVD